MGLFNEVKQTKSGVKVLGYGKTGTGKTLFGLTFPNIAAVDSEDGMAWYKGKSPNLLLHLPTTSIEEAEEAIAEIEDEYSDKIKTFIVDSETKIYENQQHSGLELAEKRARNKGQSIDDANISQREWGKIKLISKRVQSGKITLASMGINVVSIAQEKDIKEKKGENWVIVGHEPDAPKGFAYDYDIVLRFFTEKDSKGREYFKAEVKKDRTGVFKKGDIIDNPSYDCWKDVVEGTQNFKAEKVDFRKDISKDKEAMKSELEELDDLLNSFKRNLKAKDKSVQSQVVAFSKEIGIDNPLKCSDLDKIKQLIKYLETL